jgi:prepilin-type processing-associated H-X9-DG protein
VDESNLHDQGGIPQRTLRQSGICDRRIELFLCPSDEAFHAPPRTDAGNLTGFPVGHTSYKGVSGANWGEDKGEGKVLNTIYKNRGANGSFDGLIEGDGAMFRADGPRRIRLTDFKDGTSQTFLIGEDQPLKNRWLSWPYANNAYGTCAIPPNVRQPDGSEFNPIDWHNTWSFRSAHPGGLHFAFADGSVQFVRNHIQLEMYRALATLNGGETVDSSLLE